MKKTILLLIVTVAGFVSYAQNSVDSKGQRNGEWFISYTGDFQFYDYLDKLLNLDKMLVTENETKVEKDARYFEKVSYKKGVKHGDFSIYSARKNNKGKYPQIVAGEYKDGKINGNLIFLNYGNQKRICYAKYENGKIKDQEIIIEEKSNPYDENFIAFGSQKIYPFIKIKDGQCIEEVLINFGKWKIIRVEKTLNGYKKYLYGRNLLSGLIDLPYGMQVININSDFKPHGLVSIYEETKLAYDTTRLCYRSNFINGHIDGTAYWYDKKSGNAVMICRYSNGFLEGASSLSTSDGKRYASAWYKNGLLDGTFKTYYLNDGTNMSLKGPICETKKNKTIYSIVSENANTKIFSKTIPMLRKKGEIITEGKFKFFENEYMNGELDWKYNLYHSNGKKLYEGTVDDCKETDWYWYDANGKVIYSKKEDDELTQQASEILAKYKKQQSSSNQQAKSNENFEISEVKADGQTARIYHNGQVNSYYSVSMGSSGRLAGYNSKYIVTQDRQSGFIYNAKGGNSIKSLSLCYDCIITNVTSTYIIVKDGSNTIYYDFNGRAVSR